MNPFLHPTVAQPLSRGQLGALATQASRRRHMPHRRRVAGVLCAAGMAALAWSGAALGLDLNTATVAQLQAIRGIGPKTAQTIFHERERGGRYQSFEDLSERVRGIGPRRAESLRAAGLSIGAQPAAPGAAAPTRPAAAVAAPARPAARR